MAIYVVTGKLRSGKTLSCVGKIREALLEGRRVATNLDLKLEALLPHDHRTAEVLRLPDKPTVADLQALPPGHDGEYREESFGLIVLDELGAWLNTRTWGDKERQPVIDWLLHSGKRRWDVYFIIQNLSMLDKQVREGLAEFVVYCRRLDRVRVPFVGGMLATLGIDLRPPKVHIGTVKYGADRDAMTVDRWWFRGRDLYAGYDTQQRFTADGPGLHSMLTPWHVCGRHEVAEQPGRSWVAWWRKERPALKPKLPAVELLGRLHPDAAVRHWHRIEQRGALHHPSFLQAQRGRAAIATGAI